MSWPRVIASIACTAVLLGAAELTSREVTPDYVRARVERALRHEMPWPQDAVEFESWSLPNAFEAPLRATQLYVSFAPGEDFLGRISAELRFVDPEDPARVVVRRSASVELGVSLSVVVAKRTLRRGQLLSSDDLKLESADARDLPRGFATEIADIAGQRLAYRVAMGQAITRGALVAEPIVRRGQSVLVQAHEGGLQISIAARALERGARGQVIKLENPSTRRAFYAEITGPGTAQLPHLGAEAR